MKRLIIAIIIGLIAGGLCSLLYDRHISPNDNYFAAATKKSDSWAEKLRAESQEPCYIFTGCSEVRMGIDPAIMLNEYGVRAINAGGQAGYGFACNTVLGLSYLQQGDHLMVSIRGTYLPEGGGIDPRGLKFCWRILGASMFDNNILHFNVKTFKEIILNNSGEISLFLVKALTTPNNIYKYDHDTVIHDSGWCENNIKAPLSGTAYAPAEKINVHFRDDLKSLLLKLKEECRKRGAHMSLYLFTNFSNDTVKPYMILTAMSYMEAGLSVLKDETFGVEPDISCFADSPSHLSTKGTIKQSRRVAESISLNKYWTMEELEEELRRCGYNKDGSRIRPIYAPRDDIFFINFK